MIMKYLNLANNYIISNQYELALIELDKIEVLYPSSPYAKKSMLVKAYINFLNKDYEKTRALAEMYKNIIQEVKILFMLII